MLLPRPTDATPRWASNDVVDLTTGISNTIEPPEEKKDAGWNRNEPPPRQWFNWFMRGTGQWLAYLAQQALYFTINTLTTTGPSGVNALPEGSGIMTGFIMAIETDGDGAPTGNQCFGFAFYGGDWAVVSVSATGIAFGTVADRTVPITGVGGGNSAIINTLIFPVSVLNE